MIQRSKLSGYFKVYIIGVLKVNNMILSKFFKDNKTAQARRASAICSLWKIYKFVLHQLARELMLLLVNNVREKTSQKVKTDEML